jgi:hypothetical protein
MSSLNVPKIYQICLSQRRSRCSLSQNHKTPSYRKISPNKTRAQMHSRSTPLKGNINSKHISFINGCTALFWALVAFYSFIILYTVGRTYASSGNRTHDPTVRAAKDSSCFRPGGHCDQLKTYCFSHFKSSKPVASIRLRAFQ